MYVRLKCRTVTPKADAFVPCVMPKSESHAKV